MIKNSNRKYFFYYLRQHVENSPSKNGHPFGCVCISPNDDGTVSRGVSICSPKDYFNKKKARGMAFGRCNEAVNFDFGSDRFGPKLFNIEFSKRLFRGISDFFPFASMQGFPTAFEKRIMTKPED